MVGGRSGREERATGIGAVELFAGVLKQRQFMEKTGRMLFCKRSCCFWHSFRRDLLFWRSALARYTSFESWMRMMGDVYVVLDGVMCNVSPRY